MSGALEGRRVVVTGASRGIGLVIAQHLAAAGAALTLIARDGAALARVLEQLGGAEHRFVAMDVRDETAWARSSAQLGTEIHGLVTAAGLLAPIGPLGSYDIGAFRSTLDANVTGTLLAVLTCLDRLKASRGSVVTLSGGGATGPLPRFDAYAASKAAVVRLTENLAVDLGDAGVRCNSIAPGFIVTEMHNETLAAGPAAVGEAYFERTAKAVAEGGGDPPELAAELATFLVSDESRPITGRLISARWDPWRDESFRRRLAEDSDFATLRRIDGQFFEHAPR